MVVGEVPEPVDLIVVGAGPGGYAAALHAARLGRKPLLVDRDGADGAGGVCLRVGCIPSKALIEVADLAHRARNGGRFGLAAFAPGAPPADMARFQSWKAEVVGGLTNGVRGLLRAAGVKIARGTFRFTAPGKGVIAPDEGGARFVEFADAIVAAGSRPVELRELPFDGDRILDSTGALALDRLPDSLAIVGGGYIGLEIGIAYAKLGVPTAIVEAEERILPAMDARLAAPVAKTLSALGVAVHVGARARSHAAGRLEIELTDGKEARSIAADKVVVAVGRRPNTDGLELAAAGLSAGSDGLLPVAADRRLAAHVAAIGDITPGPALAHKATAEAVVAAEALCGRKTAFQPQAVPAVVFSDPEIATAGLALAEAKAEGIDATETVFPLAASGRARTLNAREGFLSIVSDAADGRVVGVHIAAPHASDLIGEGVLAIEMGATAEDLALCVHAHPTLGEMYGEAAHLALGRPLHVAAPRRGRPGA